MKTQAAGRTGPAVYRCVAMSTHGRCPTPATIAKTRIENHVIDAFVDQYPVRLQGAPKEDERAALGQAAAQAEAAYRRELDNMELREMIGADDHDRLIGSLYKDWQQKLNAAAGVPPSNLSPTLPANITIEDLVAKLVEAEATDDLRHLLGSGIQAVYVRKAASRQRNLPVADRVRIVWSDEPTLDLPRRGHRYESRPFVW